MKEKIIKLFKFLRPVIITILFTWIPCFVVIYKEEAYYRNNIFHYMAF